jgi:hypothetical protein
MNEYKKKLYLKFSTGQMDHRQLPRPSLSLVYTDELLIFKASNASFDAEVCAAVSNGWHIRDEMKVCKPDRFPSYLRPGFRQGRLHLLGIFEARS